jgi:hypothetical protein
VPLLILSPSSRGDAPFSDGPVPMWPYIGIAFLASTTALGVAILAKQRLGFAAPVLFGALSAIFAVSLSAVSFFRRHPRPLYAVEGRWLLTGCFLVFWFYDEFFAILALLMRGGITGRAVAMAIGATVLDFIIVWSMVAVVATWAMNHYASATNPPPNMRWSGLDG